MIHFVLHDRQDSVAVVVVEGVKAGMQLEGWIDKHTTFLGYRRENGRVTLGHREFVLARLCESA